MSACFSSFQQNKYPKKEQEKNVETLNILIKFKLYTNRVHDRYFVVIDMGTCYMFFALTVWLRIICCVRTLAPMCFGRAL